MTLSLPARFKSEAAIIADARLRLVLLAGALFSVIIVIRHWGELFAPGTFSVAEETDFHAFWLAGRAAFSGDVAWLYDGAAFQGRMPQSNGLLWLYPPTALLLLAPFGALPFGLAKVGWTTSTLVAGVALGWQVRPTDRPNLFLMATTLGAPAIAYCLLYGQASVMLALLALSGLMLVPRRPLLAGVLIGLLTIKPQYGLFVPLLLMATGQWRTIAAASVTASGLIAVSMAVFGLDSWLAFLSATFGSTGEHAFVARHVGLTSPNQVALMLGLPSAAASLVQIGAVIGGACLVLAAARNALPWRLKIVAVLIVTCVTSPYFWVYDLPLLHAALVILMLEKAPQGTATRIIIAGNILFPTTMLLSTGPLVYFSGAVLRLSLAAWLGWTVFAKARPRRTPQGQAPSPAFR